MSAKGLALKRHFLSTLDWTLPELHDLLLRARRIKSGASRPDFRGQSMALLFFNASMRTRVSFEAGLARFGGHAITVQPGKDAYVFEHRDGAVMDGATQEHVREVAPVLSRYVSAIGIRKSDLITTGATTADVTASWQEVRGDDFLKAFARHATVPVVNMESNFEHPCQELADRQTLAEKLPDPRGKKYVLTWAWHPKSLPLATPHSQLLSAAALGMRVVHLRPPGYDLDPQVVAVAKQRAEASGGSLEVTDDIEAAYRGAHAVCAKSYGGIGWYGRFEDEKRDKAALRRRWIVDAEKMALTEDALFMHCLPVRRNVKVTDAVIDGPRSVVVDQAENRMWSQLALLERLFEEWRER
ncbi:MAG: N-acetylornithine carbamoyltransferase [Planctomycetes bacterium]|nr:N-acetylornithine carbamoyltransferase [Planctomycetota bacterium]